MKRILIPLKVVWASPATLLGLLIGLLGLLTNGRARFRQPALQFHGGFVTWLLGKLPSTPCAMTLGHVVLGVNSQELDRTYIHELVHIRQYERWGPTFIPAYLLCSAYVGLSGGNCYLDNPFEIEAFEKAP